MYSSGDDIGALVADIGSYSTRIGFAGDDMPKAYFPSVVGATQVDAEEGAMKDPVKDYHFDISRFRENMALENVVKDGLIADWDLLEKIWEHSLSKYLKVDMKDTPVLVAEKPYNPPEMRRKMTEIMLEKFNAPAVFLSKDSVLSCFACGRTSGLVIDIGASATLISPVYDGWLESKGMNRSVVGGRALDAYFSSLLSHHQSGGVLKPLFRLEKEIGQDGVTVISKLKELINVHPTYDAFMSLEIARDAKESVCRVADTPVSEMEVKFSSVPTSLYELPDGTVIDLGIERFRVPELLCDNTLLDLEYPDLVTLGCGISLSSLSSSSSAVSPSPSTPSSIPSFSRDNIPNLVVDSMLRCDSEIQSSLLANLVLAGGGSCFDGLTERMKSEVEKIVQPISPGWRVKVMSSGVSERPVCAWLGGSILASLGSFHEMWLTRQEYGEYGAALVDRKCP
mmetsp:Transcript_21502/g.21623  ORF Transcript_21502/g.21623 Transcript_21502/m.21623 type:complete len:453 (+) Transcript_21502:202-1560(+)|eukprot:CAMPEP_0182423552 /NCGR_PEP_ID=MMETSP1167-20130531/9570_1 /TAXON_ID=2988 /ORGANISM="Mallomonas Sp, Strain CCMP3275" /LENGTH=452 /DNA_ID=CAMNT_0024602647 /DNA_START=99 /DNA_END=1457 /DNA_ORIENTATION=+